MMKPSPSSHTVLLVIFFWFLNLHFITLSFSFTVNSTSTHLCSHGQSHALLDFKNSFTINSDASMGACSSSHPRTNSWQEAQDCCYWDGVTCDTTTGLVIGIDLSCSRLQGQLSSNSSLFLLRHLESLNLAYNDFTGSEIPPTFSQFQRLTHLNLSYSYIQGEVPIEISYLSNLVSLDLSSFDSSDLRLTRLTMTSLVQNLTDLKELNLHMVNLSSVELGSLRNLSSSLTSLVLSMGGLTGIFPITIFHLPNLQLLHLYGDTELWDLQVSLPTSNWSTTSLKELEFSYIIFKNGLPSSLGNLKSLKYLRISQCGITGSIPDSIGNLTSLEYLDLSNNNLDDFGISGYGISGSIPNSIGNLTSLEYMDLNHNEVVGSIPSYLYSLPLLRVLDLSYNQISGHLHPFHSRVVESIDLGGCGLQGSIPDVLFSRGANQLTSLDFSFNSLNGTIPSSLFTLPSLLSLDLSYNQLGGDIPEFKSTSLQKIYLSNNRLQGNIPSSIFGLANLTILHFSSNNLSGTIDTSMLSKLQSLTFFVGSNNNLSFTNNVNLKHSLPNLQSFEFSSNNFMDFPVFLRGSKVLFELDLSNNKINGRVPDWLWHVGRDTLSYLNLAHNSLIEINKLPWTNLQYLDLRSNLFKGKLPLPPSTLVGYFISNNSLTGDIPTLICNTSSMEVLDLSRNNFTATIPECLGNISTFTVLDLSMNKFHGKIPSFSGHKWRSLRILKLNGNQLEGKLPISMVNCQNLEVLDIGNNNINDTFPHWLRFISELQVLILKANNFHGYIHDYKYQHSFQKLRIFDISNNNFDGSLPTKYIQGLEAMKKNTLVGTHDSMYMEETYNRGFNLYYHDSISLTIKGNEISLEKILTTFMTIDFSKNNFEGEIMQVFGALIFLKSLNLSHNNIFGHISPSIGNLRNLECLDLSSNKFTGIIPRELASIPFLGKLNLSQNALVGPIPNTNNFDTRFDNSSYQGNLALCGSPLSTTCSNKSNETSPSLSHKQDDSAEEFDKKIILYGYISGLVIGLSVGYMVFSGQLPIWLVKMTQRYRLRKLKGQIQRSREQN